MKTFRKILLVLCAVLCLASCKNGRIIPRGTMVKIYQDMLMADMWLSFNSEVEPQADTSLFYETIFHKYGYTFKDYQVSVDHYLENPEDFAKIFDKASKNLTKKGQKIDKKLQEEAEKAMKKQHIDPADDPFATAPVPSSSEEDL